MRTLIIILAVTLPAFGADNIDIGSSRQARHTLLPIVGYQYLNREQRGLDWSYNFQVGEEFGYTDSTLFFSDSYRAEDDFKPPVLGLLYRYRLNEQIALQASAAIIQDRANFTYPMIYEFFGFTVRNQISIERKNTNWLNGGVAYEFTTPLSWLSGLAQIDLGYAFRSIKREKSNFDYEGSTLKTTWIEDDKLFTIRGGVDMALWNSENLLLQGGISYAQFFPMESKADPYGGFGWRFSVFPVWSAK